MKIWPWSVIAELHDENAKQREEIARLQIADSKYAKDFRAIQNQTEYLVRTIRDMDNQIFKMGQYTDWNQMRPHFNYLHEGTISRKRTESDRINDLLRPELIKTYSGSKMIESR